MLYRSPLRVLRLDQDLRRLVDFGAAWGEGFQYGFDLVRMDAPHPRVTEFGRGTVGVVRHHRGILDFGGHVMRRYLAVRMAGGGDFELCAYHERMRELARRAHGRAGNRAKMRGNEIHDAE